MQTANVSIENMDFSAFCELIGTSENYTVCRKTESTTVIVRLGSADEEDGHPNSDKWVVDVIQSGSTVSSDATDLHTAFTRFIQKFN